MTLSKLLAMGQITPPLRKVAILKYVPDDKYSGYLDRIYELKDSYKICSLGGFVFVHGWLPATPIPPPEWSLLQPGGAR